MPALKCSCGETIGYGGIPCPFEWLFISDCDYDAIVASVDAEELYGRMSSFLKCENCGRLWVFWDGFDYPPKEYVPI